MRMIRPTTVFAILCGLSVSPVTSGAIPQQEAGVAGQAAGTHNSQLVLRDGTPIRLALDTPLSSRTASVGDEIKFRVAAPVVVDNLVVIPRGATVGGKVTESRKPGYVDSPGELAIAVDRVYLGDNGAVPLRSHPLATQGSGTGLLDPQGFKGFDNLLMMPAFVVVTLLQHGTHVAVPVGTLISGYVQGDMVLDRERVSRLQVPDTRAHVIIYFPPDRISALLCSGCSKEKKAGDPESAPRVTKPVFVGSVEATRLTFATYARLDLSPGRYRVHSTGKRGFEADLSAAQNYYLRMTQSGFGKANLDLVPASEAESDLAAATREMPVHHDLDDPRLHDGTESTNHGHDEAAAPGRRQFH